MSCLHPSRPRFNGPAPWSEVRAGTPAAPPNGDYTRMAHATAARAIAKAARTSETLLTTAVQSFQVGTKIRRRHRSRRCHRLPIMILGTRIGCARAVIQRVVAEIERRIAVALTNPVRRVNALLEAVRVARHGFRGSNREVRERRDVG